MAKETPTKANGAGKQKPKSSEDDNVGGFSVLDMLRVLAGLLIVNCGMSYMVTEGSSLTWNYRPWFTRWELLKTLWGGPLYLTEEQLAKYDGSNPDLPIYLALNGTIYDVSANPRSYGPGGSYHFFAGHDGARAFLTGCFQDDITADLRGVEEMYMPIDPEEAEDAQVGPQPKSYDPQEGKPTDASGAADGEKKKKKQRKPLTKAEEKIRREQETRAALKRVHSGIEHWAQLFRGEKNKKYFEVGKVKREPGWLEKLPLRELCAPAKKNRPKRTYDDEE